MLEHRKTIRRLLWRWGRVQEFCAARQREIEGFQELMDEAADLQPPQTSGMPGGNLPGRPTEKAMLRAAATADKYRQTIDRIQKAIAKELDFKEVMDEAINELSLLQQRVLELRYVNGFRWDFIAFKISAAEQTARSIETNAVEILSEKIKVERF